MLLKLVMWSHLLAFIQRGSMVNDPSIISFVVLDRIHDDSRGGDPDQKLKPLETKWIYQLRDLAPPCLNDYNSYQLFL